jgi:hypothetical protein
MRDGVDVMHAPAEAPTRLTQIWTVTRNWLGSSIKRIATRALPADRS